MFSTAHMTSYSLCDPSHWIIYTDVFYFVLWESHARTHSIQTNIQKIILVYTNKLPVKISLSDIQKSPGLGSKEGQRTQAQVKQNLNIYVKKKVQMASYASMNTNNQECNWLCCDWWRWRLFKDDRKTGQEALKPMLMCSNRHASPQRSVFRRTVLPLSNGGRNSPT